MAQSASCILRWTLCGEVGITNRRKKRRFCRNLLELQAKRLRQYLRVKGLTVIGVSMDECSRLILGKKGLGEVMEVSS